MKRLMALTFLALVTLVGTACMTTQPQGEAATGGQIIPHPPGDYNHVLETWTNKGKDYQGLAASFEVTATLLSREVVEHQVYLDSQKYNWTVEQYNDARQKALYDLQTSTTILVSLYTQKDEDNNLDKTSTVWNVFLDVAGKRTPPQLAKKVYENRIVLLTKYPYLNVWSKNYYVKFAIPTDDATAGNARLNMSGPVGSASLKFPH